MTRSHLRPRRGRLASRVVSMTLSFGLMVSLAGAVTFLLKNSGIDGYSGNPATHGGRTCRDCHSGGPHPTVVLEGPSHTVAGRSYEYRLTISGGQQIAGGFDVSVTHGTLAATDTQTKIKNGEVVHTTARSADSNGDVSWFFEWTAPASATDSVMYGAGLSVDRTHGTGHDYDDKDRIDIVTETCDHLVLDVNPEAVAAGDQLEFYTCGGLPTGLGMLVVTDVNGLPMFIPVTTGAFGPTGEWVFATPVPPGLTGLTVTFKTYGQEMPSGHVAVTNAETVSFL